ncbi:TetR family transcriptional regulator [Streptomyces venezuelae]|uniref:TetR/AcrR family transcriptional regulator n=1 Tax=Streptomyces venezuelae TaxID=54571 RepID=UPI00123D5977|nr:TetR family transcriptional regulator [Streptomyces venezuelae]QES13378.1 TetR family transcriptional regulator [Streptomyces venezuelae]
MKDVTEEKKADEKPAEEKKAPKSEQTRTLILETALRLFKERGYDKTTMRAIAQEAGVSVGNAYYYFSSKEHLVQGFYDRIAEEHQAAVEPILTGDEKDLTARIRGVYLGWLDIAEPYHEFAAQFFKNAADPDSPLSPFSPESEGPREAAIEVHRRVISGASVKVDPELREALPQLLWLQQMGLVLFWVYDRSEGAANSRRLVERLAPVTARAISLSRFRILRPLVKETHELLSDFMPTAAGMAASGKPKKRANPKPPETP